MSKVAIKGNASGTATYTLEAPAGSTDRTLVLPDEAGTVLTSASDINASKVKPSGISNWPAFLVSGNSGGAWRSYTAGEILQFNDSSTNSLYDNNSDFNTSTYKFTAPVDGLYSFGVSIYTLNSNSEGRVAFHKNNNRIDGNSSLHVQVREDATLDSTGFAQMVIPMSSGDTMDVRNFGATVEHFIQHSFFTGHLVAAT